MPNLTCAIPGCDNLRRYANGDCPLHYQRFRKHGTYDPPPKITHCIITSCGVELGGGRGRGFCRPHYRRWRNICITTKCSIDGCGGIIQARNWCTKHWTRWNRYGDPIHRFGYEEAEGKRVCPGCGSDKTLSEYSPNSSGRCKRCNADVAIIRRAENPPYSVDKFSIVCMCGATFAGTKKNSRYCSTECFAKYKNKANWVHVNIRRARLRGVLVEKFDRLEIFRRDEWVCQLCSLLVNQNAQFPDVESASLDHIIPISKGGDHTRLNTQTSHLGCNSRKGSKMPTH